MSEYTDNLLAATREQLLGEILRLRGECATAERERNEARQHVANLLNTHKQLERNYYRAKIERASLRALLAEVCELAAEANGDPSSCSYSVIIGDRVAEIVREAGCDV